MPQHEAVQMAAGAPRRYEQLQQGGVRSGQAQAGRRQGRWGPNAPRRPAPSLETLATRFVRLHGAACPPLARALPTCAGIPHVTVRATAAGGKLSGSEGCGATEIKPKCWVAVSGCRRWEGIGGRTVDAAGCPVAAEVPVQDPNHSNMTWGGAAAAGAGAGVLFTRIDVDAGPGLVSLAVADLEAVLRGGPGLRALLHTPRGAPMAEAPALQLVVLSIAAVAHAASPPPDGRQQG